MFLLSPSDRLASNDTMFSFENAFARREMAQKERRIPMSSLLSRANQERAFAPAVVSPVLRFQRAFFAACIILTPLVCIPYAILNPLALGASSGKIAFALNEAANLNANQIHLVLGIALSFLLPLDFLGMAWLAMRRSPWLATTAGLLGLLGWIPWSALIGQEGLTVTMVQLGGGDQFALLWDRFNSDFVIHSYLLIYIAGHLLSAVLLGIALGRTRLIPVWAAWAFALTSPLQAATFIFHAMHLDTRNIGLVVFALWFLASIPAAVALLRGTGEQTTDNGSV
jgi:hypothetical protein